MADQDIKQMREGPVWQGGARRGDRGELVLRRQRLLWQRFVAGRGS